jgi:hypothetical protein
VLGAEEPEEVPQNRRSLRNLKKETDDETISERDSIITDSVRGSNAGIFAGAI